MVVMMTRCTLLKYTLLPVSVTTFSSPSSVPCHSLNTGVALVTRQNVVSESSQDAEMVDSGCLGCLGT